MMYKATNDVSKYATTSLGGKKVIIIQRHLNSRNRDYHNNHMKKEKKLKYA